MLVRRWGILWKSLGYSMRMNALIPYVCAQLHNRCVDRWLKQGRGHLGLEPLEHGNDPSCFMTGVRRETNDEDDFPPDDCIEIYLANQFVGDIPRGAFSSEKKLKLMEHVWACGITFDPKADNDYSHCAGV